MAFLFDGIREWFTDFSSKNRYKQKYFLASVITILEGLITYFVCGYEKDVWLRGEHIVILFWFTYVLAEHQLLDYSAEKKGYRIPCKWLYVCPAISHMLFHVFVLWKTIPLLSSKGAAALGLLALLELLILGAALRVLYRKCREAKSEV